MVHQKTKTVTARVEPYLALCVLFPAIPIVVMTSRVFTFERSWNSVLLFWWPQPFLAIDLLLVDSFVSSQSRRLHRIFMFCGMLAHTDLHSNY